MKNKKKTSLIWILTAFLALSVYLLLSPNAGLSTALNSAYAEASFKPEGAKIVKTDIVDAEHIMDWLGANEEIHDRSPFSEGEKKTAELIKGYFDSFGVFETELQEFSITQNGTTYNSQNVVSIFKSSDKSDLKRVIIGAHYDNTFSSSNGHGAYDNLTGITAMLLTAKNIASNQASYLSLPFDIVFVAFGAEEAGYVGSYNYASKYAEDSGNILLMINFDAIGGGDNLYMYCDEVSRAHETYLRDAYSQLNSTIPLHAPPKNKKTFLSANFTANYSHYGLLSSNNIFVSKGINSASFLSLNWEMAGYGITESSSKKSIINTSDDTLENLKEMYPDYASKITACSDLALYSMTRYTFSEAMTLSRETRFNYSFFTSTLYSYLILLVLLAGLALASYYISKKWNKENPRPIVLKLTPNDIKAKSDGVFGSEYENPNPLNDIFSDIQNEIEKKRNENNPFDGY